MGTSTDGGMETVELRREIRGRAEAYERARAARIRAGERIRSRLLADAPEEPRDRVLRSIRDGEADGPLPCLSRVYRESWRAEQAFATQLHQALDAHPAWPWLRQVAGVPPALAGKLLGRLDVTRADRPSAFWAYCGLATVARPDGGRMAQPGRDSDVTKNTCHALGASLLRANGPYARQYRSERERLEETRGDWPAQRKHLTALRKMEKLFLAHLWLVWREAVGLPVTIPHENDPRAHTGPWDMVQFPRRRWLRNPPPRPIIS